MLNEIAAALISVAPAISKIDLSKDLPETTVTYTNNTKHPLEIKLSAVDFSPVADNGQFNFLTPVDGSNYNYSLSSWISFDKNILEIPGESSASAKIYVDKNKLPLGGHYASILADVTDNVTPTVPGQVKLNTVLTSLLFVRAESGHEIYEASLESFSLNHPYFLLPSSVTLRLQNTGNGEIQPHGKLDIINLQGQIVSQSIINPNSVLVLPNSLRRFDSSFTKIVTFSPPGIYTAKLTIGYGPNDTQITRVDTLFSLGTHPQIVILLTVILIFSILAKLRRKSH